MNIKSIIISMAVLSISAMSAAKPLFIGISEAHPLGEKESKVMVNAAYVNAVAKAGHIPVVISRFGTDEQFDAIVSKLDLLLMTGGEDIAPSRYNTPQSPKLGAVNVKRDDFDFRLYHSFFNNDVTSISFNWKNY